MFADLQAKAALLTGGLVVLLVSNVGSYFYGRSDGKELQKGKQATVEVVRATAVASAAIAHTGDIINEVKEDNDKEGKANDRYEIAMAELRKSRAANRDLISANGGMRISASVCAERGEATGQTEATSSGKGHGATTGTVALPEQIDADLQRQADEADAILEKLRVLRDWAIDQGFAKPEVISDGPEVNITY